MIIRNKKTKELLNLEYNEFLKRFAPEIQIAFESFKRTEFPKFLQHNKNINTIETDFYFQLQWNFNHFTNSNWYIEKL